MEEQFQQITNIINELAASNPYITKEQIAKARSMYNGDMRPIDQIREELEAYSTQIMVQGKKREADKELLAKRPETKEFDEKNTTSAEDHHIKEEQSSQMNFEYIQGNNINEQESEVLDTLRVELPGEDKQKELQSMIDDALGEPSDQFEAEHSHEHQPIVNKEQVKVLIKQQNDQTHNTGQSASSETGYGNVTALLSLTIICSIVTIIIALLTILIN